jgi:hypothetical protein
MTRLQALAAKALAIADDPNAFGSRRLRAVREMRAATPGEHIPLATLLAAVDWVLEMRPCRYRPLLHSLAYLAIGEVQPEPAGCDAMATQYVGVADDDGVTFVGVCGPHAIDARTLAGWFLTEPLLEIPEVVR